MIRRLSGSVRQGIIFVVAVVCVAGLFFVPPIAQDPSYHDFADRRGLLGIPNFADVVSNLFFIAAGIYGLMAVMCRQKTMGKKLVTIWNVFFGGVLAVGVGSACYHYAPSNFLLVWDRLPMTVAFMSLFAAFITERMDAHKGVVLFPWLLLGGALSVLYWDWTENIGHGDLRPYAFVQFFPILALVLILLLFKSPHSHTRYVVWALGLYALAKVFELLDHQVYDMTRGVIGGHMLKHAAAAAAVYFLGRYVLLRRPVEAAV